MAQKPEEPVEQPQVDEEGEESDDYDDIEVRRGSKRVVGVAQPRRPVPWTYADCQRVLPLATGRPCVDRRRKTKRPGATSKKRRERGMRRKAPRYVEFAVQVNDKVDGCVRSLRKSRV